jgi:hypothetical protein
MIYNYLENDTLIILSMIENPDTTIEEKCRQLQNTTLDCHLNYEYLLRHCISRHLYPLVEILLSKQHTDINVHGNWPIILAIFVNDFRIVKLLVKHGADPHYYNKPLVCALQNTDPNLDIIKFLIETCQVEIPVNNDYIDTLLDNDNYTDIDNYNNVLNYIIEKCKLAKSIEQLENMEM